MPEEPALSQAERQARDFISRRVKGQALAAFDEVTSKLSAEDPPRLAAVKTALDAATTALRQSSESELRSYQLADALASYANGQRSVADIRDAAYAEYGHVFPVEALVDLFGLLERGPRGIASGGWCALRRPAVESPELILGLLEGLPPFRRQAAARSVFEEREHRHGGLEG